MSILGKLVEQQNGRCFYCNCAMTSEKKDPCRATVEHLKDKWASPHHQKIEDESNLKAACYKCNNARGAVRNRIARRYYQRIIDSRKLEMRAASVQSNRLYKLFGPVPELQSN